ncbi:hypothetical protein DL95DRAFT_270419, partial [Leptodontidium sp. 2 PMI_412]
MIKDEISTFNKPLDLKVIGTPYWLTSESKRIGGQRAASLVIAFATEEEQTRAIRNRLSIGGISVRVEKIRSVLPSTQCTRCLGYGHLQQRCPKPEPNCAFCAGNHHTREHACTACGIAGSPNTIPPRDDFTNFSSTTHQSFVQIAPNHPDHLRPRTLAYVSKTCELNINLAQNSPCDTDIQIISVSDGQNTIQVTNLYNQTGQDRTELNTFQRHLKSSLPSLDSIIIGDFNAHHYMWEP